ncbi:hypothetical protein ACSRUE_00180 [Sorangium sp. KYC3313]|uniref:hypothetical protein n=1 Tax=Sorangium sp. KYC3313 TaxID=3449740 RepID=UPI003F8BE82D
MGRQQDPSTQRRSAAARSPAGSSGLSGEDRRLLRELGFRRASSSKAAPASEDADEETDDDSDSDVPEPQAETGAFLTGAPVAKAKRKAR